MKIAIGCDHGGFELKDKIVKELEKKPELEKSNSDKSVDLVDCGCNGLDSVDYPMFAKSVAKKVASGEVDFGILVCTTGVGMCVQANKVKGVRAVLVLNEDMAHMSREHNNCNVLCMGKKYTTIDEAMKYIEIFTSTPFSGGRHERRVNMFEQD